MANIIPITQAAFSRKCWKRTRSYAFAGQDAVCPLVMQELPKAVMCLPIAFIKQTDKFVPVAVQGLVPGRNLLVSAEGKWRVGYVPAVYRGFPFSLRQDTEGQSVLCVDEDSGLITDNNGIPFFTDKGEPSEEIREILNFLVQVHQNRQLTQQACDVLQQYELIEEWPISLKTEAEERPLQGLFRINETRLTQLDDACFAHVRTGGALPLIYCQLLSMQHLTSLVQHAEQTCPPVESVETPDIDKLFGEEYDLFHFD